jgi:geranylgeranyl reductase
MVLVAIIGTVLIRLRGPRIGVTSIRGWTVGGCSASAVALAGLVVAALYPAAWPLRQNVFVLGVANGVFAVAAIGSMMTLVSAGGPQRQGLRMGLWGAAQAIAFAVGGALSSGAVDLATHMFAVRPPAYAVVFAVQAVLFIASAIVAFGVAATGASAAEQVTNTGTATGGCTMQAEQLFDAVVIGGGPAGSTAATDLARRGHSVLLLDRAGRIKPCGGAIPPKLVEEFEIPPSLLVARVTSARMISPTSQRVDMPIDGGYVGMVDREIFDEWLRERARIAGCVRRSGVFESLTYDSEGRAVIKIKGYDEEIRARVVVGADGAQSAVARQCMPSIPRPPYVAAYHEIIQRPKGPAADYDPLRCDVFYQGELSPDFYAWIFPHGDTLSVGVGSARKGFSLRRAVDVLRERTGLDVGETIRCEGAPIPLRPLRRWDDGRRVVLAGDAAGVVAPASGEGIYYAMAGGRYAAEAADRFLSTSEVAALRDARRRFMKAHGRVFFILGMMQRFWYSSDHRRERFVSICKDPDVQRLTWEAYMHKRLTRSRPLAHVRIFFKDLMHLAGVART